MLPDYRSFIREAEKQNKIILAWSKAFDSGVNLMCNEFMKASLSQRGEVEAVRLKIQNIGGKSIFENNIYRLYDENLPAMEQTTAKILEEKFQSEMENAGWDDWRISIRKLSSNGSIQLNLYRE